MPLRPASSTTSSTSIPRSWSSKGWTAMWPASLMRKKPSPQASSRYGPPASSTAHERGDTASSVVALTGGSGSAAQHAGEDQGRHDRRVGFDDELRRVRGQLAPGDLLVRHGAGIRAVARRGIADLAEVAPAGHVMPAEVLLQHRHDADREIAGDASADLEEADRSLPRRFLVPVGKEDHVLD